MFAKEMITLNTINNQGSWNAIATALNLNFDQIIVELEKLNTLATHFVGYYEAVARLTENHPNPAPGTIAWVGTPYPGTVYIVDDEGEWSDTGEVPATGGLSADQLESAMQSLQATVASLQTALQNALNEASAARTEATAALNTVKLVQQTVQQLPEEYAELLRRIRGTSEQSDPVGDPFRLLGNISDIAELNTLLSGLHSTKPADGFEGTFRVRQGNDTYHIESHCIYYVDDKWLQVIRGLLAASPDGATLVRSSAWNILYRTFNGTSWSAWSAFATAADVKRGAESQAASEAELLRRIQGISEQSNPSTDPFRLLGKAASIDDITEWLDGLHSASAADAKGGSFRILYGDSPIYVENFVLNYATEEWVQTVRGRFAPSPNGASLVLSRNFALLWRCYSGGAWGAWKPFDGNGVGQALADNGERFNDYTNNTAGTYGHAEGCRTQAGPYGHAEGNQTVAADTAHAEGYLTKASGLFAHAEGTGGTADGFCAHVEGNGNTAADTAHAEGYQTKARGTCSHTEGAHTLTENDCEHAQGHYNRSNDGTLHSVGIGTSETDRKNAVEVMDDGRIFLLGVGEFDGTNPGESSPVAEVLKQAANAKTELLLRLQGTSEQSDPSKDPFLFLGNFQEWSEMLAAIDNLHGNDDEWTRRTGTFRLSFQGVRYQVTNTPTYILGDQYTQTLSGPLKLDGDGQPVLSQDYGVVWRKHRYDNAAWSWSAWTRLSDGQDMASFTGSLLSLSARLTDLEARIGELTGATEPEDRVYIRSLGNYNTWAEFLTVLDGLHSTEAGNDRHGLFRIGHQGVWFYVKNTALHVLGDQYLQVIDGLLTRQADGTLARGDSYGIYSRRHGVTDGVAAWTPFEKYTTELIIE